MKKIFYSILVIVAVLSACVEEDEKNAQLIPLADLKTYPDFFWFEREYNDYTIYNLSDVDSIRHYFAPSRHRLIIFTSPDCACGTAYTYFPKCIKYLDSAGISEKYYEIYIVGDSTFKHPYMAQGVVLRELPNIFLFENDTLKTEIRQMMQQNKDSLSTELYKALK